MDTVQGSSIARLNDRFRGMAVDVMLTPGVIDGVPDVIGLLKAVESFDAFTESNDPYGEHDFGSLIWHGEKVFWQIDYYDPQLTGWCDPLAAQCRRVMTVMLAREY